jgi:hypothetical protein
VHKPPCGTPDGWSAIRTLAPETSCEIGFPFVAQSLRDAFLSSGGITPSALSLRRKRGRLAVQAAPIDRIVLTDSCETRSPRALVQWRVTPGTSFNRGTDHPRPQPERETPGTMDSRVGGGHCGGRDTRPVRCSDRRKPLPPKPGPLATTTRYSILATSRSDCSSTTTAHLLPMYALRLLQIRV